ncbi:MAG TPA: alpha/beta hydrolase [Burkholderiaceae bacterium]|nr:alpha/beta hydrolase [Burkholderiaceae bacterium]
MNEARNDARSIRVDIDDESSVSGLLQSPPGARACLVLAHGAGAGMAHPFMSAVARGLAVRGIATLRYQFSYMEQGGRRPDPPALAHRVVRAAVACTAELLPALPLFAGGKSFGGRMTSQAQAAAPLAGVRGLVFLGFPLHAARRPSDTRGAHLSDVAIPMLFVQGERDALADPECLRPLVHRLGERAALEMIEHADHSFHVPKRSGSTDAEVLDDALDTIADWIDRHAGQSGTGTNRGTVLGW